MGPNGGVVGGGGNRPATPQANRPGSVVGGGGRPGGAVPGRPTTGPARPVQRGGSAVGQGRPVRLPGDGGLGNVARPNNVIGARPTTVNVNRQALVNRGNTVRGNFNHYNTFHGNWWGRHPGAWRGARWTTAAAVFGGATWAACSNYCGYPAEPVYYDYGSNVVYEGDNVYVNGDPVATVEQYAQQAVAIADTGRQAPATKEEEWMSLGVFAMVQGEQTTSNDLFQLAVNKAGTIRGNYYNALSDTTLPVYGKVDKKTQRAAWTIGDRTDTTYEVGVANLTKAETTMLVHFGKDGSQQWTLVRVEAPPEGK
jgi:hypothetical protein